MSILGLIPGTHGLVSLGASYWGESEQDKINKVFLEWLKLQKAEAAEIFQTVTELMHRLNLDDDKTRERVESPVYLALLRKAFRNWSAAESETKREAIRNLLANAAKASICQDKVLVLFLGWIEKFDEMHFSVIKAVYSNPGSSRADIWEIIGEDQSVREDSAEADLFKLLISDLSAGRIIRQERHVTHNGQFLKDRATSKTKRSSTMISAFEDGKPYQLTELGKQFVHYCLNDIVPKIGFNNPPQQESAETQNDAPIDGAAADFSFYNEHN